MKHVQKYLPQQKIFLMKLVKKCLSPIKAKFFLLHKNLKLVLPTKERFVLLKHVTSYQLLEAAKSVIQI
ncbi:MAG: hypothetical protein A2143_05810 [Gallionellales bacterium RBG_16_57_15]|nr:MAG: hypothetical protein A2143_05810 [Gallionellales bacterium RBG_16_57_15]